MKKQLCWFCNKKTKDWRVMPIWNAEGKYEARFDFVCVPCMAAETKRAIMVRLAQECNVSLLVGKN